MGELWMSTVVNQKVIDAGMEWVLKNGVTMVSE